MAKTKKSSDKRINVIANNRSLKLKSHFDKVINKSFLGGWDGELVINPIFEPL
jgi:hypothetical protein